MSDLGRKYFGEEVDDLFTQGDNGYSPSRIKDRAHCELHAGHYVNYASRQHNRILSRIETRRNREIKRKREREGKLKQIKNRRRYTRTWHSERAKAIQPK